MAPEQSEAAMMQWKDREAFLLDEARQDLEAGCDVRPCLVAMAGDRPLFVAFLRAFDKGRHLKPLVELVALAAPLDADRLALSLSGRAWSLEDPLPPVVPGVGDLRQRVVVIESADASAGEAVLTSTAMPFDLADGRVGWGEPIREGGPTGMVSEVLGLAVRERHRLRACDAEIWKQFERCGRLGHLVGLAEPVYERLVA